MSDNSATAGAFVNSFMQGFSFIDDINSRKRQEQKLDQRLAEEAEDRKIQREIQRQGLAERGQDRANSLLDRQERKRNEQRQRDANAILADPNADPEELMQFADLPGVSAILRQQGIDVRDQADLQALQGGGGLSQQITGDAPPPAAEQPAVTGGLSQQVQAATLPDALGVGPERMTKRDLDDIARTQGGAAAMQARDAEEEIRALDVQPGDEALISSGPRGDRVTTVGQQRRDRIKERQKGERGQINKEWGGFLDIEDRTGDQLRTLNPNFLTAKYFDDRSNISDPNVRQQVDARMAPTITETINTQQEIITNADPGSRDDRNARRKLSEAYGLANEIGISYQPLTAAGVDDRGLPLNNVNPALTDSVIQQTQEAAGTPLPPHPNMTRADTTMINRGTAGNRVNQRFATAAFRQYKNGRLTFAQYDSLMRTGNLPAGQAKISQTDPKKDTWMTYTNPNTGQLVRQLVVPARDPEKDAQRGRNLIDDEGLAHINRIGAAYDTKDDPTRGIRLSNSFISALAQNENRARQMGYDLSNVNDVGVLFERWTQLHVIRDQYNDEWFNNGQFNPDFTEDYGELDEALFNRAVDQEVDRASIADFGGTADPLTELKQRDPAIYQNIREGAPEFANASDEEIEQALQEQGL